MCFALNALLLAWSWTRKDKLFNCSSFYEVYYVVSVLWYQALWQLRVTQIVNPCSLWELQLLQHFIQVLGSRRMIYLSLMVPNVTYLASRFDFIFHCYDFLLLLYFMSCFCLSSWYARECIFLALVICKLQHNWLAFARLNILSDGIWGKCNHGSARSIIPGNLCFYKLVVKFEICSTSLTPLSPIFNTFSSHMFLNYAVFICDAWWILIVIIIVRPLSMPLQHFLPTFLFLASVEGTLLWGLS